MEQPTEDGGTAGVAVLDPKRASGSVISDSSQRHISERKPPVSPAPSRRSPFDAPLKVFDSDPLERVLDTKRGDLAGTALNIAAEAVARGGKVLYIGANSRECNAVAASAASAGLSRIMFPFMEATWALTGKVIDDLRSTLRQGPPSEFDFHEPRRQLAGIGEQIDAPARALSREIRNTGVTGYEALATGFSSSAVLGSGEFSALPLREWSREDFDRAVVAAGELDDCIRAGGLPGVNPWRGSKPSSEKSPPALTRIEEAAQKLSELRSGMGMFLSSIGFDPSVTEGEAEKILRGLRIIEALETGAGESLKVVNLRSPAAWLRDREELLAGIENQLQLAEALRKLEGRLDISKLRCLDLHAAGKIIMAHQEKGTVARFFDNGYRETRELLERVAHMPERVEDVVKVVGHLDVMQKMLQRADDQCELWARCFPQESDGAADDLATWRRRAQLTYALIDLFTICESLNDADSRTLLQVLRRPEALYSQSVQLGEISSLAAEYKQRRTEALSAAGFSSTEQESGFTAKSYEEQEIRLRALSAGGDSWSSWQQFSSAAEQASSAGLEPLVSQIVEGKVTGPKLASGITQAWFKALAEEFNSSRGSVIDEGKERSELIRQLLTVDAQIREENAALAAKRHWTDAPRFIVGGQSSELYRMISDESPAASVDELFAKAPQALQHVKPFMVADLGGAAKIASGAPIAFDLVILDEGVSIPEDHPLRSKVGAGKVIALTGSSAVHGETSTPGAISDAPRASWQLSAASSAPAKDQFQAHLKKTLEHGLGLTVHADVQTPGGVIDLAISGGSDSKRYHLAIFIDGLNSAPPGTALERESAREEIALRYTGHPALRVWIPDWYRVAGRSRREFLAAVERALNEPAARSGFRSARSIPREPLQQDHVTLLRPYEKANVDLSQLRIIQRSQGSLRASEVAEALVKIVKEEGPIHRDELAQRFMQNAGLRVLSDQMALQIVEGEQAALKHKKIVIRDDFLYPPKGEANLYPRMRGDLSGTLARFERIPVEELESAICLIVKRSHGISKRELPAQLFRAFGYKGVPFGADAVAERKIDELLSENVLTESKGILGLGERSRIN